MSITLNHALVGDLAGEVSGSVLAPGDAGYDAARGEIAAGPHGAAPLVELTLRTSEDLELIGKVTRRCRPEVHRGQPLTRRGRVSLLSAARIDAGGA